MSADAKPDSAVGQGLRPAGYCSVCASPLRGQVDEALAGGDTPAAIRHRLPGLPSVHTIRQHRRLGHVPGLPAADEAGTDPRAVLRSMLRETRALYTRALRRARRKGASTADLRLPSALGREVRELARQLDEADRAPLGGDPAQATDQAWADVRAAIMAATDGLPDVRRRIAEELLKRGVAGEAEAQREAPEPEPGASGVPAPIAGGPQASGDRPGRDPRPPAGAGVASSPPGRSQPSRAGDPVSEPTSEPGPESDLLELSRENPQLVQHGIDTHVFPRPAPDPYAADREHLAQTFGTAASDPNGVVHPKDVQVRPGTHFVTATEVAANIAAIASVHGTAVLLVPDDAPPRILTPAEIRSDPFAELFANLKERPR